MTILIDSGSSHNILQPRIAEFLGFPNVALNPFSVLVGTGDSIQYAGSCANVPLTLSGELFKISFFILPIHGADVVLGVQWLQKLGKFISHYTVPMIQFTHNHKTLALTGNNTNIPAPASLAQFSRFLFINAIDIMPNLTPQQPNPWPLIPLT